MGKDTLKAVSSLVSELLLLVITVFLAVTIYGWTSKLVSMLARNPLPPLPEISNAYLFTVTSDGKKALFLVFRAPNAIEVDGVYVYFGGNLICSSSNFILSSDDPKSTNYDCKALRVAGYYGIQRGLDQEDSYYPGLMLFSSGCQRPAADEANFAQVGSEWFYLNGPDGYADPWVTVISAVPQTTELGGGRVETSFSALNSAVSFQRYLGEEKKAFYSNAGWVYVPVFKTVKVSKGTYTIILWCPNANLDDYDRVKVSVVTDVYVVSREVSVS